MRKEKRKIYEALLCFDYGYWKDGTRDICERSYRNLTLKEATQKCFNSCADYAFVFRGTHLIREITGTTSDLNDKYYYEEEEVSESVSDILYG